MATCISCETNLPPEAKYCPQCGTKVSPSPEACSTCGTIRQPNGRFCIQCGTAFQETFKKETVQDSTHYRYNLNLSDLRTFPAQLREAFLQELREVVLIESHPQHEALAIEEFFRSGFFNVFDERSVQLTAEIERVLAEKGEGAKGMIDRLVFQRFHHLINRFFTLYAPELLRHPFPQLALRYEDAARTEVNLRQMIIDYLEADKAGDNYYTNAVEIPFGKLSNARKSYFFHSAEEYPVVFGDLSLLSNGKEGFVFTTKALYWKAPFHKAHQIVYQGITNLELKSEWLLINGFFFNATPDLNYKVYKLLQKLLLL